MAWRRRPRRGGPCSGRAVSVKLWNIGGSLGVRYLDAVLEKGAGNGNRGQSRHPLAGALPPSRKARLPRGYFGRKEIGRIASAARFGLEYARAMSGLEGTR